MKLLVSMKNQTSALALALCLGVTACSKSIEPERSITIGPVRFDEITVKKFEDRYKDGVYSLQFSGQADNTSMTELSEQDAVKLAADGCKDAVIIDHKNRSFKATCSIPPLLPSEGNKDWSFVTSNAYAHEDMEYVKVCIDKSNCSVEFPVLMQERELSPQERRLIEASPEDVQRGVDAIKRAVQ